MKGKEIYLGHGLYMYIHDRKPVTKEQILKGPERQEKGVESKHKDKIFKNCEKTFFKGEKWVWKNEG
jgi:hypothetical protein